VILYDVRPEQTERYGACGALVAGSIAEAAERASCILLAVKPQNYPEVLEALASVPGISEKLFISIAAGITSGAVSEALGGARVVRVLPNTPMMIGCGVSVICRNEAVSSEQFAFVQSLFDASGRSLLIDESEMNRYISVTSSSPAYVFLLIRAICDGAAAQGLGAPDVLGAVCDMVAGSARLLAESGKTPDEMIRMVASKGGTTERALAVFAEEGFADTVARAMQACTDRADELGKKPSA
jgi:pyrroline-5-carboxylate reductase